MKNYRPLVPILMVVLMAASVYTMISQAASQKQELEELIQKAESCSEQGLYDKAAGYYRDAIEVDNRIEYYLAVIDMYYDAEKYDYSQTWCEETLEAFPGDAAIYERAIKVYLENEEYSEAFGVLDKFDGRKLTSETVEGYREVMEDLYYENGVSFDEITVVSAGYVGSHNKNGWGLASSKGASIIAPKYEQIGYYANDMVAVLGEDNIWYFMNSDGEYLYNISQSIPGSITEVGLYNNDVFPVCVDGKYRYYSIDFSQKFEEYDYAGTFSSGVAAVKNGETWQLIKSDGTRLTEDEYQNVILDERGVCCQQNRIFVEKGGEYILLDSEGNRVGTETFDDAKAFSNGEYGAVMRDGLWGFVNLSGEVVLETKYDEAKSFSLNLAPVSEDGRWGYIDISGNEVIEPQYTNAYCFYLDGTAFVQEGEEWKTINLYKYNH